MTIQIWLSYEMLKWFLVSTTVCQEANVILSIVMLLTVKVFSVLFFQNSFSIHLSARKRPQVKGKKFRSIEEKMAPPNHPCPGLLGFKTAETPEFPATKD